jgi:Na+/melibiose symporter-like transporter
MLAHDVYTDMCMSMDADTDVSRHGRALPFLLQVVTFLSTCYPFLSTSGKVASGKVGSASSLLSMYILEADDFEFGVHCRKGRSSWCS